MKYVPKWFPGAGFQTVAEEGAKLSHDVRYRPFYDAKEKIVIINRLSQTLNKSLTLLRLSQFAGTARRSFTSEQIALARKEDGELSKTDEELISAITGICYLGQFF